MQKLVTILLFAVLTLSLSAQVVIKHKAGAPPTLAFVSGNGGGTCGNLAVSINCNITLTSGQTVWIATLDLGGAVTVADNGSGGSNTYNQLGSTNALAGLDIMVFCANVTHNATIVTASNANTTIKIASLVASGVTGGCTANGSGSNSGDATSTQTTATITPYTITAGSLVINPVWASAGGTTPSGAYKCSITSWVSGACTDGGASSFTILYKIESTTSAPSPVATFSASNWSVSPVGGFK